MINFTLNNYFASYHHDLLITAGIRRFIKNFEVHFTVRSHALKQISCLPQKEYRLFPVKALAKCHSELQQLPAGQEYCS